MVLVGEIELQKKERDPYGAIVPAGVNRVRPAETAAATAPPRPQGPNRGPSRPEATIPAELVP